ncbi:TrkA family potassium uptake protein [Thioalkalivibrio sp. XN279]|uniref:potassium channel family protein n=1 Tax=Thioalkalivibrio sp. XN279 TaxID=2714953 RepID=UPI00140BC34A|nr:TrkA family potassium uptake protein [Thioalkalivibrio sp. XN279]NHA13477.1 TrkA family potassium uptake protein [Thioalkalivibrio sp. XN279]
MAEKHSRFVVIGLGRFGSALAKRLAKNGHRVTGVDVDEEAVQAVEDCLANALVADGADEEVLKTLDLPNAAAVFISLGDHANRSIVATMFALELGAQRVMVKGIDALHAKILRKLGKVEVFFAEEAMARYIADHVV